MKLEVEFFFSHKKNLIAPVIIFNLSVSLIEFEAGFCHAATGKLSLSTQQ